MTRCFTQVPLFFVVVVSLFNCGCRSPYYADRGAGIGALAGAGAGALIGEATGGNAGTGALIGAGLGAFTGAAVGSEMDQVAAQNRAQIAAQLGRQVQAGAANIPEVIAMTHAGVDNRLILNYVQTSGVVQPIAANDVIYLHDQGVATEVIEAMQTPTIQPATAVASQPPVIVEEHYHGPAYVPRVGFRYGGPPRRRPRPSFGFTIVK